MKPEHAKLDAIKHISQAQKDFVDFLTEEKGFVICVITEDAFDTWQPAWINMKELLAEYHGIDLVRLEQEKEEMLEEIRSLNAGKI